jgi:hypothetical protein
VTEKGAQIGRLAMRVEGEFWIAYYAQQGTMAGAIQLGLIRMRFVQTDERKQAFMDLMRDAVGDLIEEIAGVRPIWGGAESAPEHERAGSA